MKKLPILEIKQRAEFGDPIAEVLLGFLLEHGIKMAPNRQAAAEMYRRAAEQGCLAGEYALAFLAADTNPNEGIEHFRKAAEAGYAPAQLILGCIFQDGELTEPDNDLALRWIQAAADQDFVPAILHLSIMYSEGISIERDVDKAMHFRRKAAGKGDPHAAWLLGADLVLEQDESKVKEGLEWIWRAAQNSIPSANGYLANMYGEGLHGKKKDARLHDFFFSRSEWREEDFF